MSCICCDIKLDLKCLTVCDVLTISFTSPTTETYTLLVDFGQQLIEIPADIESGNELIFDISNLNQAYTFTGQIINEAGDILTFRDTNNVDYNCFLFQTIIGLTTNQPSINLTLAP